MKRKGITLLIIVLLMGIVTTGIFLGGQLLTHYQEDTGIESQVEYKPVEKPSEDETESEPEVDFASLTRNIPDAVAWLTLDGTAIDYPVVQTGDNDYYLHNDATRTKNRNGALFLDYRNNSDFKDYNNIIYGHNMRSGLMFAALNKFKQKDFFASHETGKLYTKEGSYKLRLFSVVLIQGDHPLYQYAFTSPREECEYLSRIQAVSRQWRDPEMQAGETLLMLSTCSFEFNEARTVVYAKVERE